jgi:dimeric dUTPase (all-alpha-NTP-PPase superfamily)
MLKHHQIMAMLQLQANMNVKVNPEWLTAGYLFLRASVVEGTEALEHHGWKWWKRQDKDLAQMRMEFVDIWHFTLSEFLLRAGGDLTKAAWSLEEQMASEANSFTFDGQVYELERMDTPRKLELLIGLSVSRRIFLPLFTSLLVDVRMDWSELYRQYVAKNVLNFFRQDHGYKDGTYIKVWAGQEDNECLVEIMLSLDPAHVDYQRALYTALKVRYDGVRNSAVTA